MTHTSKGRCGRNTGGQVLSGLIVIAFGVLFLLDNFHVLEFSRVISFWPSLLFVLGVFKLLDTRSSNGYMVAGSLMGAGVLLMLHNMGLLRLNWGMLWPSILIAVGGAVVVRALGGRQREESLKAADDDSVIESTTILGSMQRRVSTPDFRGGEITTIMGGCNLDLRGSSIQGDVVLHVFAAMGGIVIKCPPDWTVVLQGMPFMGGFEEKTVRPADQSKRLIVKGWVVMGGVKVRN
ncbi:MAG: LiaI-LiaF-like domain-containing protein [Gammaproteobacteria bacterium]